MDKKIAVFQFRIGDLETNEQEALLTKLGLQRTDIIFLNVLQGNPRYPAFENLRAIILCGSGDNSMTAEHGWYDSLAEYVRTAIDEDIPVLGICFGHQFLGKLYGARVINDPQQKELGTITVSLTEVGKKDPLFASLDSTFKSAAGHNDSVVDLPEKLVVLAYNDTCAIQAFKATDAVVYGVQFHPELTEKDFKRRLEFYKDHYVQVGADYEALLERGRQPTTDHAILKNFYHYVVQG